MPQLDCISGSTRVCDDPQRFTHRLKILIAGLSQTDNLVRMHRTLAAGQAYLGADLRPKPPSTKARKSKNGCRSDRIADQRCG